MEFVRDTALKTSGDGACSGLTDPAADAVSSDVSARSWAQWLQQVWPRVDIRNVELRSSVVGGRECVCVRAYVRLGALLPIDVDVRVERGRKVPEHFIEAGEWPMFSRSPMMNGDYLYETDPVRRLGDAECVWTVVVAPARPVSGLWHSRVMRTVGDDVPGSGGIAPI